MATRPRASARAPSKPAAPRAKPAAPELAKLTRPRLFSVSPRERLFRLLDELRERPAVWITGAPGSGKSALVASYLDARRLPAIWYNVDAGDRDPATFFYYLGMAAPGGARAPKLPLFTDEYRRDLAGFGRRWFREFFARLPAGTVVVFDNVHEAEGRGDARAAVLAEIPAGVNVVMVSRTEPPAEFARLAANQTLARVGPEALRFTREEACALVGDGADPATVDRLWARADGWAAGLILLREHARGAVVPAGGEGALTPQGVFGYFAGEIFNRMPPENQRLLALMALPPRIRASVAVELTGEPDAPKLLEYGYRRHLFVARRDRPEPSYEFHALFREFLLERARQILPPEELAAARRRVAALGESRGLTDGVFELYRDAGDWDAAVRVTLADAPTMLAQGRYQSLAERIDQLPSALRAAEPGIAYWEGIARMNVDPPAARASLERAYEGFAAAGDRAAQIRAVEAMIVTHYLAWDGWRPLDRWIDVMEGLLGPEAQFATPESEARALSSLAIALVYRQPGHPMLPGVFERLATLIDAGLDPNLKVAMATRLLDGLNKAGAFTRAQRVAEQIRPVLADPEVRPLTAAWFRLWFAMQRAFEGRLDEFTATIDEALALAAENGLAFFTHMTETFRAWGLLTEGRIREATALVARLRDSADPARRLERALLHHLEAWVAAARGDFAAAEREARSASQLSLEAGSVSTMLVCHTGLLLALQSTGQREAAESVLERMLALVADLRTGVLRYHVALWEAWIRLRNGEERYREPLAEALALGRREGYLNNYFWWPPMMSELCAAAIGQGIEVDYVRRLVAARGLPPPDEAAPDAWPWPLAIRALGRFEVLRDGAPITFAGKAQKKPLELVKALVALGGEGVDAARLAAILWPDATGDAAKVSFDSTLYRTRKLIGLDAALVLNEGKLSLDPRHCWIDVRAFERVVREADALSADAGAAPERLAAAARSLVDAYPGHFLAGDEDQAWLLAMRDRLRSKLVRSALALGRRLQAAGRPHDAVAIYQRALELDNLAEDLYRQLMVCLRDQGERAAALQVYRRCRELLSVVLGMKPSPETESVRRSLDADT
jgi:ATP/maltotriose-dependent transcriptional regulator MalT/DNA-binding SARP family transcriptional activator